MSAALGRFLAVALVALPTIGGCGDVSLTTPGGGSAPSGVEAVYRWELDGWRGAQPVGRPTVVLGWELPAGWRDEPFRVYARRAGGGGDVAIATVTSCAARRCVYTDVNVAHGARYEYYVVAVDAAGGRESAASPRVVAQVPQYVAPAAPASPRAVALDRLLYLHWQVGGGAPAAIRRYEVYLVGVGTDSVLYRAGHTDGTGYLDPGVVNGSAYTYRVAAVDTLGHYSAFSAPARGVPRPDYQAELMYVMGAIADSAGFRFVDSEGSSPIVAGTAAEAQWRLESINGVPHLRPLGQTAVAPGVFTTALACGPGADGGCRAVETAPATGYSTQPVPLEPELTYVLRVRGADGRTRYGKVRVQHLGAGRGGRSLMIFGWAYQLRADETSLSVGAR